MPSSVLSLDPPMILVGFERVAVRVEQPGQLDPRTPPTTACDITFNLTNATRPDHRWSCRVLRIPLFSWRIYL